MNDVLQTAAISEWLCEELALAAPLDFQLIPAGRSNLTYVVTDRGGRRVVLRRAPEGHVLQSAHDVVREHRLLAALEDSPVPVPRPLALCRDPELSDMPLLVMEFIEGMVPASLEAGAAIDAAELSMQIVDTLLGLHAVDPDAVGLGDLGLGQHYAQRQLSRWAQQNTYMLTLLERPIPLMDEVATALCATLPAQQITTLVHGDFSPGNVVMSPAGYVQAVLDWELATRGDPLCDLGHLMTSWAPFAGAGKTSAWPPVQSLADRYAAGSELDLTRLPWYLAFARWRGASIGIGVWARYVSGAPAGDVVDPAQQEAGVLSMLEEARCLLNP